MSVDEVRGERSGVAVGTRKERKRQMLMTCTKRGKDVLDVDVVNEVIDIRGDGFAFLVLSFFNVECPEESRDVDEESVVANCVSDACPSAVSESSVSLQKQRKTQDPEPNISFQRNEAYLAVCQCRNDVLSAGRVQETFRTELLGIWVDFRIAVHCPAACKLRTLIRNG